MIESVPGVPFACLNIQMCLVSKIRSGPERSQPDKQERLIKQANDISDVSFALQKCEEEQLELTEHHVRHLGSDDASVISIVESFWSLAAGFGSKDVAWDIEEMKENWDKLVSRSGDVMVRPLAARLSSLSNFDTLRLPSLRSDGYLCNSTFVLCTIVCI